MAVEFINETPKIRCRHIAGALPSHNSSSNFIYLNERKMGHSGVKKNNLAIISRKSICKFKTRRRYYHYPLALWVGMLSHKGFSLGFCLLEGIQSGAIRKLS